MALISSSDLEAKLQRSLTSEELSYFSTINDALQAEVEKIIGSSVEDVALTTRYYDGGLQHLPIDPCTDITSVKQYDDDFNEIYTYLDRDHTKEPINQTLKTTLQHRSGPFVTGMNNIGVEAKFSIYNDADTLAIVKSAMLDALAAEMTENDNVKRESIEGYSIEYMTSETKNALAKIKVIFPNIL